MSVLYNKTPLLPNEGKVDGHSKLNSQREAGDNLTPHHIPSAGYMMKKFGIKPAEGISIMVEQPYPGFGGRHRRTETYGKKTSLDKAPRDEMAKDILDLRRIYKEDELYGPIIKDSLQEVINQNKSKFPEIFEKK